MTSNGVTFYRNCPKCGFVRVVENDKYVSAYTYYYHGGEEYMAFLNMEEIRALTCNDCGEWWWWGK